MRYQPLRSWLISIRRAATGILAAEQRPVVAHGFTVGYFLSSLRDFSAFSKTISTFAKMPRASHFTFAASWRNLAGHDSSVFYSLGNYFCHANRRARARADL